MPYGAGVVAARRLGAVIVDPRPFAVGSIRYAFAMYPHLVQALPAMGYGERQIAELRATIERVPCDVVIIATPVDLARLITIEKPTARVTYELEEHDREALPAAIRTALARHAAASSPPRRPPRATPAVLRSSALLAARRRRRASVPQ
jgi:predicted GTPase